MSEDNCYEVGENDSNVLLIVDFWVSGISLGSVGFGGIIGNILTLLALASERKGSQNSFNR